MDNQGLKSGQIAEVRGYADRRLLNSQDPNDYRNRRVSIIVKPLDQNPEKPLPVGLPNKNEAEKKEGKLSTTGLPPPPTSPPGEVKSTQPAPSPKPETGAPATGPVTPPDPVQASTPAGPPPKVDHNQTAAANTPPPGPKEANTDRGPLEDNLDLQKELLNLVPKLPVLNIK
jgi:hypothetical protein